VRNFQRDINDEIVDACMTGSIADPTKKLSILQTVFVGDVETLQRLTGPTAGKGGVIMGFDSHVIYNLTPDAEHPLGVYEDQTYEKMHNLLVPMGGQHALKGHRAAALLADYVNELRPEFATWMWAISPVLVCYVLCWLCLHLYLLSL
jgi:hypothetical protein